MKHNKHLDSIIDQAVKASFQDGKLLESQVTKIASTFEKLPKSEAIYLLSGFLKGLKREQVFHELQVESAVELSADEVNQIKRKISNHYTLTATRLVKNPKILGGVKVHVGDMVYDFSLKQKIEQIREAING